MKSQRGVQFRRWATGVLRRYLLDGYAVDDRRLKQLGKIVKVLARSGNQLASGITGPFGAYTPSISLALANSSWKGNEKARDANSSSDAGIALFRGL